MPKGRTHKRRKTLLSRVPPEAIKSYTITLDDGTAIPIRGFVTTIGGHGLSLSADQAKKMLRGHRRTAKT